MTVTQLAAAKGVLQDNRLRRRVIAVCCSTQTEVTLRLDRGGSPLGRAISWLDWRGAAAIARRTRGIMLNIDGYSPWRPWRWLRLTGGVPSSTVRDSAGQMAFVRDEIPDVYERTHELVNTLDFLTCACPDASARPSTPS